MNIDWLAGFYEGEGNPHYTPGFGLMVFQKEREVLEVIKEAFGGTIYDRDVKMHSWWLYGNEAAELAIQLLEHMHSPYKIEQLKKALILNGHMDPRTQEETNEIRVHKDKIIAYRKEYGKKYRQKQRLVREYIEKHPEVLVGKEVV